MIKMDEKHFVKVCNESQTMAKAAATLRLHYNTFRRYAKKLNCFNPNPGVKNVCGEYERPEKIPLEEILQGKHPSYQTYKLKKRLIETGIKKNQCEECSLINWRDKPLSIQLEHIDGNRHNHLLENLKMLCPNCHSQTPTFCAKNVARKSLSV
jgi:hypothetical protein